MKKHLYFKLTSIFLILFFIFITTVTSLFVYFIDENNGNTFQYVIIAIIYILTFIIIFVYMYFSQKERMKEIIKIQDTFDFYSTKLMSEAGVGIAIFNKHKKIIWVSSLIEQRFSSKYLGKNIEQITSSWFEASDKNESELVIEKDNLYYSIEINYGERFMIIIDITQNYLANQYYENEKLVLGFIDIDSYAQYQIILEEETVFKVDLYVVKILDYMTLNYGVLYKKFGPGKFLLITNNSSLKEMQKVDFEFMKALARYSKKIGVKISLSLGFGVGSSNYNTIESNARAALTQSHARGGDQITISSSREGNLYYGGTTEAMAGSSRIKIRSIAEKLSTLLKESSKIKRVIITGHIRADLDAVGASLGLVAIAKAAKKDVYIANSSFDNTASKGIKKWVPNAMNLFIKPNKAKRLVTNQTLVIIVDTTDEKRIESIEAVLRAKKENIFIFDHHRLNTKLSFQYLEENSYVDTSASSTCEIIAEIIRFTKYKVVVPSETAQFMLAGIYMDTNRFQKTTSYKTYEAASWLERKNAIPQEAVDILKPTLAEAKIILKIEENTREIKPGFVLSVLDEEISASIIASAANKLLETAGRKAAFVIGKSSIKNIYLMSARSINVNVQIIAQAVGGGGHFSAAAATTEEPLEIFQDNLIQAIISTRYDENNND